MFFFENHHSVRKNVKHFTQNLMSSNQENKHLNDFN